MKKFWKNCTGGLGLGLESLVIVHNSDFFLTGSAKLCRAAQLVFVLKRNLMGTLLSNLRSWTMRAVAKITVALRLSYTRNPQFSRVSSKLSRCELSTVITVVCIAWYKAVSSPYFKLLSRGRILSSQYIIKFGTIVLVEMMYHCVHAARPLTASALCLRAWKKKAQRPTHTFTLRHACARAKSNTIYRAHPMRRSPSSNCLRAWSNLHSGKQAGRSERATAQSGVS